MLLERLLPPLPKGDAAVEVAALLMLVVAAAAVVVVAVEGEGEQDDEEDGDNSFRSPPPPWLKQSPDADDSFPSRAPSPRRLLWW